ncbi:MAG: threonine synthase [Natronincolaceae bacterium]|jgi:threonine synthase|nr:threonine synthase [Clostridiales bacterium]
MKNIMYNSTRGEDIDVSSIEALVRGIAYDGGLYVPTRFYDIGDLNRLMDLSYKDLALEIIRAFFPEFSETEILNYIEGAYDNKFNTSQIAPIVNTAGVYFLELFHGPTLAFKDMALTLLPYLLMGASKKNNNPAEIVILTATSGDTGKAALEAFKDVKGTKIIVLFPSEGVSEIQKRQMITQEGNNTFVIAIKGCFDDAQNAVKQIFADKEFNNIAKNKGYILSSANSINVGRLIPQTVYYFYAYLQMLKTGALTAKEKINIVVPTGNFGNILAAYYCTKMGLPVNKLICASNENNVLYDFFKTGMYDKRRTLRPTISPSMDIIISSNLERLLYDISGEDAEFVRNMMKDLNEKGYYEVSDRLRDNMNLFYGGYADESDTLAAIEDVYNKSNYLMDTHTAVAYSVYKNYFNTTGDNTKTVVASTASPFKFARSVCDALKMDTKNATDFELVRLLSNKTDIPIPSPIYNLETKPIFHNILCEKDDVRDTIKNILGI